MGWVYKFREVPAEGEWYHVWHSCLGRQQELDLRTRRQRVSAHLYHIVTGISGQMSRENYCRKKPWLVKSFLQVLQLSCLKVTERQAKRKLDTMSDHITRNLRREPSLVLQFTGSHHPLVTLFWIMMDILFLEGKGKSWAGVLTVLKHTCEDCTKRFWSHKVT